MVENHRLPVLQDTREVDVERTYGIISSKAWRVFNRAGCVASDTVGIRLDTATTPEPLMELLRRIDSQKGGGDVGQR